jgi:hypothetical protein
LTDEKFPNYDPGIWFELAKDALDTQLAFVDAVDAKLGNFLATGSGLLALLAAVYALRPDAVKDAQIHAFIGAAVIYGVLALTCLVALWGRSWGTGPDTEELRGLAEERNYSDAQVRWKAQARYIEDTAKNEQPYAMKVLGLRVALIGLVLETGTVAVGLWLLKG